MPTPSHARLAPAVTIAFGTCTWMWIAWFVTHLPLTASCFPPAVAGPIILLVALAGLTLGLRSVSRGVRTGVGVSAGVIAGVVNLLLLGSMLTAPTGGDMTGRAAVPSAGLIAAGFVALMGVLGFVASMVAMSVFREMPTRTPRRWLGVFAVVTVVSALPLIAVGGLVTSGKAGMAVPDWPGTYGGNMFLYPIGLMTREPRVFLEHSHRLFGSFVGLTTLVLVVFTFVCERRSTVRVFAGVLLVAVIAQGLLGAFRVLENSSVGGMVHGVLAQVFIAGAAAFAARVSATHASFAERLDRPPLPIVSTLVLAGALLVQLVFGSMIRHLSSMHALYSHIVFSIVVTIIASIVGAKFLRLKEDDRHGGSFRRIGHALTMLAGVQFLLGWGAFWAWSVSRTRGIASPTAEQLSSAGSMEPLDLFVRTLHQANGALLCVAVGVALAWVLARRRI